MQNVSCWQNVGKSCKEPILITAFIPAYDCEQVLIFQQAVKVLIMRLGLI